MRQRLGGDTEGQGLREGGTWRGRPENWRTEREIGRASCRERECQYV